MGWNTSVSVRAWITAWLFFACSTASALAQPPGASYAMSGRVRCVDQQGKPCSTAGITITLSGNVLDSTVTRRTGSYIFSNTTLSELELGE